MNKHVSDLRSGFFADPLGFQNHRAKQASFHLHPSAPPLLSTLSNQEHWVPKAAGNGSG